MSSSSSSSSFALQISKIFSYASMRNMWLSYSFSYRGLRSIQTDLPSLDGTTTMHCWVPKSPDPNKPNLLLVHGIGSNALWQWNEFVSPFVPHFNLYVPDLLFFGNSYSSLPDRSVLFQSRSLALLMDSLRVPKMNVIGLSYGGFVAYGLASEFPDRVDKLVLCAAGVCMEEKDLEEGMFQVRSVDEAVSMLFPQTPEKVHAMLEVVFYRPAKRVPEFFLQDLIDSMFKPNLKEKTELVIALHKGRKLSDLLKITQPTLIIWGEQDKVFPLELAHRLVRHLDGKPQLAIVKDAGHAINVEKPKEMLKHMMAFLVEPPS
ncbi:hypothetical protein MLD38_031050 [Melastoma candidum]|uniref:Uncharacterized protein n=1 Tax=Melastoma candidum TaxID=119954 RepID=A0ACB9MNJ1_9MYRT|nr:hypothetical protein MLD38_031050 [Melastoma candidum]